MRFGGALFGRPASVRSPTAGVALITGASSGIGREMARTLAHHGHSLALVARRRDRLEELAVELQSGWGTEVHVICADLADPNSAELCWSACQSLGLSVSILINSAGVGNSELFKDASMPRLGELLQVNVVALTKLTRLAIGSMIDRHEGWILNVASTAAFWPGPNMAVYSASKAYVLSFSESLAEELLDTGISLTVLCPGPVDTEFYNVGGGQVVTRLRRRRLADPAEVANFGYKSMMRGKIVATNSTMNAIVAKVLALAPRSVASRIVFRLRQMK